MSNAQPYPDLQNPPSKIFSHLTHMIMIKPITVFAMLALLPSLTLLASPAFAQRSHTGRVTRSFTEPIQRSVVASTETGVIKSARVHEGDRVQAGDELAALNHNVLLQEKRLAIARVSSTATRDAARSRVQIVRGQKEKLEALIGGGHVNPFEVEQKTTEYENAIAELTIAEDELRMNQIEVDRIQAQIGQRIIVSPIEGVVTEIHKQLGEHVSSNEPEYATIVRIDQLKVRFYHDAKTLSQVPLGSEIVVLVGESRTRTPAKVTFVSPVIDPDSGTGRMDVLIENQDQKIASGTVCFWDSSNEANGKRTARSNDFSPLSKREER